MRPTSIEMIYCDSLVINLDNSYATMDDQTFLFNINGDGIINDGSELFGTSSGDGFIDLSAFNSDKNGWIDENDYMMLYLKDADVGAIYLCNISTTYGLNNQYTNDSYGRRMSSRIYLHKSSREAGSVNYVIFLSGKIPHEVGLPFIQI